MDIKLDKKHLVPDRSGQNFFFLWNVVDLRTELDVFEFQSSLEYSNLSSVFV